MESGQTIVSGTTQFVDDRAVVVHDTSQNISVDNTIIQMSDTQSTQQSIIDYLAKPIVLQSGVFSTSDTYSFFNSFSMPLSAFTSAQGAVWTQKVAGYFGIRMTMRFTLKVNGNRFQQGRYILGWVPLAGAISTTSNFKNIARNNMMMGSIVQRTTVPHVEIDISRDTSAVLEVPFVSVANFWPLNSILGPGDVSSLGYINLYPYSPLVAPTGSTSASYTVYVSFHDVKLIGAASAQSSIPDKEVTNKANGPISGMMGAFARGFKEFEQIPLLSSYARSVSWVSDRLSKAAVVFGYSKPTQGESLTKMTILNAPSHALIDGDSDARSMALISKPGVTILNGLSGKAYDEMDFSYLARKYANFNTFTWSETSVVGNLTFYTVQPYVPMALGGALHFPPVSFIAAQFQYWRGSLKYRFKIVKTEFHSGRLSFAFYPSDEFGYYGNPVYVNRTIVDIRDTAEVEIVVPYIARNPFTPYNGSIGRLVIDVVDPLVAPASVSASVTILSEICAGDDFEVAIPAAFEYTPTQFVPQSDLPNDNKIISTTVGNSKINADPTVFSSVCIGDKVSSYRALLKRFTQLRPNAKGGSFSLNNPSIYLRVDAIPILNITPPTNYYFADMVGVVASCYAIWRGGVRIRDVLNMGLVPVTNQNPLSQTCQTYLTTSSSLPTTTSLPFNNGNVAGFPPYNNTSLSLQQVSLNNVVTLEIPQYCPTLGRNVSDTTTDQSGTSFGAQQTVNVAGVTQGVLQINLPASVTTPGIPTYAIHNIYRSMADDGDLSCFISIPPMVANVNVAGSTPTYNLY